MKQHPKHARRIIITGLYILVTILSLFVANLLYNNDILVNGALGISLLYFQFYFIRSSGIDVSLNEMLSEKKPYKYFIYALLGTPSIFWAGRHILELIDFAITNLIVHYRIIK